MVVVSRCSGFKYVRNGNGKRDGDRVLPTHGWNWGNVEMLGEIISGDLIMVKSRNGL